MSGRQAAVELNETALAEGLKAMADEQLVASIADMVDELGSLESVVAPILAPIKPQMKRIENLRSALRESQAGVDAEDTITIHGKQYKSILGPRNNERQILEADMPKVYKALGRKRFFKYCHVALKHLEALGLGLEYVVRLRSGPRPLQTIKKAA